MLPEYFLEDAFCEWLRKYPHSFYVGSANTFHSCPIAAWIKSAYNIEDVGVAKGFIVIEGTYTPTPLWVQRFLRTVDNGAFGQFITVEKALRALEQVRKYS